VSLSALLTFFPNPIKEFVKNNNWPEWSIFTVGAILTITVNAILNIYRTIFFDKPEKELVRNSWEYYTAKLSGEKMKKFKQMKLSEYKSDFDLQNPNNVLIS
jgi:Rps23 Pro-64 3,4-dihydroxylase Tpa1-like proline 4-hydroxylase